MKSELDVYEVVAEIIRRRSAAGALADIEAIRLDLADMAAAGKQNVAIDIDLGNTLQQTLQYNEDLEVIFDSAKRPLYYSRNLLSTTYARITVLKSTPVEMMAQTIRDNSTSYRRPVPLDLFEQQPFDLEPDQILASLQAISENDEYSDIAHVTTSQGSIYLYSSNVLEHDYAGFLAEREDVELFLNP